MRFFTLFILFILFLSFSSKEAASNPFFNTNPNSTSVNPAFYPNFSNPVSVLPQGTPLVPICSSGFGPACFNQWMSQSIPLSVGTKQFNYFAPSFIPQKRLPIKSTSMKGWKKISRSKKTERRSFYFNSQEPEMVRMVETNSEGETKKMVGGRVTYINTNDIKAETETKTNNTNEGLGQDTPSSSPSQKPQDQREESNLAEETQKGTEQGTIKPNNEPSYTTRRETLALPASGGIEVQPGCFKVNKMDVQAEASFCFECIRNIPENQYFKELLKEDSFLSHLKNYLTQVRKQTTKKINKSFYDSDNLSGDGTNLICSPLKLETLVTKNFESTCPPYNYKGGFKKFFGESLCKSCQKGVPLELLMAKATVESDGKCTARNTKGENSAGFFQVDSNQHQCKSSYKKGTTRNANCLAKIHNNWNKAIEILLDDFYTKTNPPNLERICKNQENMNPNSIEKVVLVKNSNKKQWLEQSCKDLHNMEQDDKKAFEKQLKAYPEIPCKDWIDMESQERDAFRRAVSGYNGGSWLLSAIRAAKNNNRNDQGSGKYKIATKYKYDSSNWEEIRLFFFTQQIKSDGFSKRSITKNLSNLAHTEAILGREIKNSVPGMIEIWSQYKRKFLKENPEATCTKPVLVSKVQKKVFKRKSY